MSGLDCWVAGAFDMSGYIYERTGGGLALRIHLPHRSVGHQLRARFGGTVAMDTPARWTIKEKDDLTGFQTVVKPLLRGQHAPMATLELWLNDSLSTEDAEERLRSWYRSYPVRRIIDTLEEQSRATL